MTPITAYLFAAMTSWSPLSVHAYAEPAAVTEARYERIAEEVAATVADEAGLTLVELALAGRVELHPGSRVSRVAD